MVRAQLTEAGHLFGLRFVHPHAFPSQLQVGDGGLGMVCLVRSSSGSGLG
jgi:hypothetical protein